MPTIYDIAEAAGVSASTVSRSLKNSALVNEGVKARVMKCAKELGFERRNVKRQRSRTILNVRLVLPNPAERVRGSFYDVADLVAGLRDGFAPSSLNLVIDLAGPDFVAFPHKKGGDIDAFVFAFQRPSEEVVAELKERGVPFSVIHRFLKDMPCVAADSKKGMSQLVSHMLEKRPNLKPAFIALDEMSGIASERITALVTACQGAKVKFDAQRDVYRFSNSQSIRETTLRDLSSRYNALICVNDIVGSAVLNELSRIGIKVPEQVLVSGFDDSPLRSLTRPLLTTVAMPVRDLACRSGQLLAGEVIEGKPQSSWVMVDGQLLVGETTV